MVAQSFRRQLPAIASERMLHAVEAFASIFVPFYFFHAGLALERDDLTPDAFLLGVLFVVLAVPFRIAAVAIQRRVRFGENLRASLRIGAPMLPTLVFTLVIAEIIRDRFTVPPGIYGGLVVYAIVTTLIPSFLFRAPAPEFAAPTVLPLPEAPTSEDDAPGR
jgi:Kef-type K+ transport system membrane component KefB